MFGWPNVLIRGTFHRENSPDGESVRSLATCSPYTASSGKHTHDSFPFLLRAFTTTTHYTTCTFWIYLMLFVLVLCMQQENYIHRFFKIYSDFDARSHWETNTQIRYLHKHTHSQNLSWITTARTLRSLGTMTEMKGRSGVVVLTQSRSRERVQVWHKQHDTAVNGQETLTDKWIQLVLYFGSSMDPETMLNVNTFDSSNVWITEISVVVLTNAVSHYGENIKFIKNIKNYQTKTILMIISTIEKKNMYTLYNIIRRINIESPR